MRINYIIRTIIERITTKGCDKCCHCIEDAFCDNYKRYSDCVSSIYPKEFEPRNR